MAAAENRNRGRLGQRRVVREARPQGFNIDPAVVAVLIVGPPSKVGFASSRQYRRWDLNPHPLARTGF